MKQPSTCTVLVIGLLEQLILQETIELRQLLIQSPLVIHHELLINQILPSTPAVPKESDYWYQQYLSQQKLLELHFNAPGEPRPQLVPYILSLEPTRIEAELTEHFTEHFKTQLQE